MDNDIYLILANSKKSMLILGFFTPMDLIIFGVGCTFTLAMLFLIRTNTISEMIILLLPALITGFLVMPVPYYHNVMTLIGNIYNFYKGRRRYYWKGWCIRDVHREQ